MDKRTQAYYAKRIKEQAKELGFDLCGITSPDPPPHFNNYMEWLSEGFHGNMEYMNKERARNCREDPKNIFPECKSIIVLAENYYLSDDVSCEEKNNTGKIARYAWGKDYHNLLASKLETLVDFIEVLTKKTVKHRIYVDTGPLLERELAQRAGLGWIGKNTMLINPDIGSWTFLAEVMLDLKLPYDKPYLVDRCGSCTLCIDSCPTKAISIDTRGIDSRKCISYLTIEHKGLVDLDKRSFVDDWLFGCDICQEVCPWNQRFAQTKDDSNKKEALTALNLSELLDMDEEQFSKKFNERPIKRTKRVGLIRNASLILSNNRSDEAFEALSKCLEQDLDPIVRAHCAWAIGQTKHKLAYKTLKKAYESEKDLLVQKEILDAIGFTTVS